MRTAIDTNILSAFWSGEPTAAQLAKQLHEAKQDGALVLAPIVYAELLAYPKATPSFVDSFLSSTAITVDFTLDEYVWKDAGQRFARYAGLRRKSGPGEPKRLIADFIVGSHALMKAERLMTLDATRYRQHYSDLKIVGL